LQVFHDIEGAARIIKASAVAIGNFDGCHLGHQALLNSTYQYSQEHGISATVLTFYPHPVEILRPEVTLERLTTASEKLLILERLGMNFTLVQKFDRKLAELGPEEFF